MIAPDIKTEHYLLRPFRKDDATLWQKWDTDPEVQAHMPEPKNEQISLEAQYTYLEECEADPHGYYWSIETKAEGVTIGTVALTDINTHHAIGELGIVLGDKNFWGKGVATEVLTALTTYVFSDLGLERINAEVEAQNIPMQKVLHKVGFEHDGTFKSARVKNGKRIDIYHFGITS